MAETKTEEMRLRRAERIVPAVPSRDVPGLALQRMIATPHLDIHDPFLLLSDFSCASPGMPVGGFTDHPHRGFETVTYMIAGEMHHRDSTGTAGVIGPGGVQWMTAGRGIIHAETPVPDARGGLRGFQLWLNLPATEKMSPPAYQEFATDRVPVLEPEPGVIVRLIAGAIGDRTGPVTGVSVRPLFLDVSVAAGSSWGAPVPADHAAFVYAVDGTIRLNGGSGPVLEAGHLAVLGEAADDSAAKREGSAAETAVALSNQSDAPARVLLAAAAPIREPIARYGPFVMNTEEEIFEAFRDYQEGRLA